MLIKTKKYRINIKKYIFLALKNILMEQWWVCTIPLAMGLGSIIWKSHWFWIIAIIGYILYWLFWLIQFFGVTQIDQNKIIFENFIYEITSQKILMKINTKKGMPITWSQVQKGFVGKDYFLLVLSKAHFIYLPYKIFYSNTEIKFFTSLLKKKNLYNKILF